MRKTKIVATLGPATSSPEAICALVQAGMDVARLNFSHGCYDEHRAQIERVRAAALSADRPVALLLDLQGPKIRTGPLVDHAPIELATGATLRIATGDLPGDISCIGTPYLALPHDVEAGDRILISDGRIELRVVSKTDSEVATEVVQGGFLDERQGINLPGVAVSAPGMTPKDIADLEFGLSQGIDYIAMSFVRSADDVLHVKQLVAKADQRVPVIAKLERCEAIEALDEILAVADGVMVARGDLGVELAAERVPLIQKHIIRHANQRACPVITATQMLESMISNSRPTRAEASDVANAILDGTDALMLSGETAIGTYAREAVATMARIALEVESAMGAAPPLPGPRQVGGPDAIGAAVNAIVRTHAPVRAVCVLTQSGGSARLVAMHRPRVPILAFCPNAEVCRRLSLLWGVIPLQTAPTRNFDDIEREISALALDTHLLQPGDMVVLTGSHPFDATSPTNFLKLLRLEPSSDS